MRRSPLPRKKKNNKKTQNSFDVQIDYFNAQNSRINEEVVTGALESKDTISEEEILFGGNPAHDEEESEKSKSLEDKQVRETIHLSFRIEFWRSKVNSAVHLFQFLSQCFFQSIFDICFRSHFHSLFLFHRKHAIGKKMCD